MANLEKMKDEEKVSFWFDVLACSSLVAHTKFCVFQNSSILRVFFVLFELLFYTSKNCLPQYTANIFHLLQLLVTTTSSCRVLSDQCNIFLVFSFWQTVFKLGP